ncbi:MAG TPA: thioredoxin domain-containing protein, partial [Terriglobales bacterium]|nr:thioredoxin domain-containing protein [Terriglobales bacterium]
LVVLAKRALLLVFLLCLGCAAQSNTAASTPASSAELNRRIALRIRERFQVPSKVDVVVGERKPSDFPGYDTLTVTLVSGEKKTPFDFLISKDNNTLARFTKMDVSAAGDVMSKIDLAGRPVRGNPNAKVVVVNFDDFQCPYCAEMHSVILESILKPYGDRIKLVYKDYPLPFHPWARHAAMDANCLAAQNADAYWGFADYVHTNLGKIEGPRSAPKSFPDQVKAVDQVAADQAARFKLDDSQLAACLKTADEKAIEASIKEGDTLGVDGTPTMFVNGEKVDGAVPPEELRRVLDRALRDAGQPVPAPAEPASPPAPPAKK